jgi:hypothetical protein
LIAIHNSDREIVRAGAKKVFIFSRVSQSGARAEILFAAPNCDARCLFALRELKPARLQPWLRSLGCDRQRQSPPHLADRRAHARTPRFIDNGSARGLAGGDAFRSAVADQRASRNYWRYSDREALKIWPVEKMVGNVRNNGPQ